MALVKKYKCMNLGNCDNAKTGKIFEIAEGEKLECPICHKDMLVEVKGGPNFKLIAMIAAVLVVVVAVFMLVQGGSKDSVVIDDDDNGIELVDEPTDDGEEEEAEEDEDKPKPTDGLPEGDTSEVKPQPVDDQEIPAEDEKKIEETGEGNSRVVTPPSAGVTLNWASYEGPTAGGKPHGVGGTLNVTKSYTIDLKDGKGGKINVAAGDKIKNTKFKNGNFIQGELQRKNGQRVFIEIGG